MYSTSAQKALSFSGDQAKLFALVCRASRYLFPCLIQLYCPVWVPLHGAHDEVLRHRDQTAMTTPGRTLTPSRSAKSPRSLGGALPHGQAVATMQPIEHIASASGSDVSSQFDHPTGCGHGTKNLPRHAPLPHSQNVERRPNAPAQPRDYWLVFQRRTYETSQL